MTSKPCSMAHPRPARKAAALPPSPEPRTFTLVRRASGAREWMMPLHAVAWPKESSWGPDTTAGSPSSPITTATPLSTATAPSRSGWSASMPLSTTATRTPLPVEPPHAHSGDRSSRVMRPGRRRTADSLDHAGRGCWSATFEQGSHQRSDAGVANRVVVRQRREIATEIARSGGRDSDVAVGEGGTGDPAQKRRHLHVVDGEAAAVALVDELEHAEDRILGATRHAQEAGGTAAQ